MDFGMSSIISNFPTFLPTITRRMIQVSQKQPKKQSKKVYRSIAEFKEQFFPNSYAKELAHEKSQDPKSFGTGLVQELLEGVRQQLRK